MERQNEILEEQNTKKDEEIKQLKAEKTSLENALKTQLQERDDEIRRLIAEKASQEERLGNQNKKIKQLKDDLQIQKDQNSQLVAGIHKVESYLIIRDNVIRELMEDTEKKLHEPQNRIS